MPSPRRSRPTLSVVVPVYNVAGYLQECIESIQLQSVDDVEIVAVDDGSTDDSSAILAELAARDGRLRVVTQANQGLGAARNAGVDHATGEFLWFVDSDDRLVPGAIATMLATITTTGSDLATGNVSRLIGDEQSPTRFVAETFARTRLRTHIRRFPLLINDRVAWNKVYRRSFWDHHGFRFPTGVHYEDQYVTLPAHYLARKVDVRREPIYLWRVRADNGSASITQQRTDPRSMLDRIKAVTYVSDFLADRGRRRDKLRYDASAVTHDLRYFLDVFDTADPAYRNAFLAAVNGYLANVDERAFAKLPGLRRLQWEVVRRGDADRVADLVGFEHHELAGVRASRAGRAWYVEVPGRDGPSHGVAHRYEVRRELMLTSTINSLAVTATSVRIDGHAAIDLVGDVARRLQLLAVPQGGGLPRAFDVTISGGGRYHAQLPIAGLLGATRGRAQREWRLILLARDHGLRRIASWHELGQTTAAASRVVPAATGNIEVRIALTGRGRLSLAVTPHPITVRALEIDGDVLEVAGDIGPRPGAAHLVVSGPQPSATLPLHVESSSYLGRVPLAPLDSGTWRVEVSSGGIRRGLHYRAEGCSARIDGKTVRIGSGDDGYLTVVVG